MFTQVMNNSSINQEWPSAGDDFLITAKSNNQKLKL